MKSLISKSVSLIILLSILLANSLSGQSTASDNISYEVSYLEPSSAKEFKANVLSVVVNHEEQYSHFQDFKKAVKKNKSLTLVTVNSIPKGLLKTGFTYEEMKLKRNGKTVKLKGVIVEKNQPKGKNNSVRLSYKGVQ